jgi:hypothetical protein
MAKSSFGKLFLICAGIGGAAGIIAGLGDRAEAATPPKPKSPVKKHRKVASAEGEQEENEAVVGGGLGYGGPGSGGWGGFTLSSDSGGSKGSGGGGSGGGGGSNLTPEEKARLEKQYRDYAAQQFAEEARKTREANEAQAAAQKRQADYDAQSVAGQEKVVLDKTIKTSGLPLWTKLGWTKDGTRTLILVVPSFDHNMTMPDGTTKLQPKDALWRGAQLLAKKYKDVRAYDVAVQWSD